ncbi:RNA-dependent RNA polymerase [Botrytis cinerea ourmia-like virus 10]|uniref:RNA-dependent RNA polymerase n=1 Tax=Botrytis cinerea ourmia-like virus 10 TaxID=2735944 RepID=A0ABX6P0L3_9VIRU|nr:RNA-dependent RNA polymerase [Botrytis cinerea ourmia-like virus 10]QJT73676.1 RNA-dependent RNA polymerase [Botrytis cinerea ourmia-like virus 10]
MVLSSSTRLPTKREPLPKSASGGKVKRCTRCVKATTDTKETIHNGLLIIRARYGIPYCELPDSDPRDLSRFLNFLLLQGQVRASVAFPRRQIWDRVDSDLCRLQRLGRMERWELAHSVSSIKRNLPAGCSVHTPSARSKWEQNALSHPPPSSAEYLAFVKATATRLFPAGWDRRYTQFVTEHVPNSSARCAPKSLADQLWMGRREEFHNVCLNETDVPPVFLARYKEVPTAGKCRPMLIFDEKIDFLGPLHKLMYAHLRRTTDWLLCGPPTAERMTSVCVNAYQTSVDLVAATDNLNHDVAQVLLDALFFTSVKIPRSLRALAKGSLSPFFKDSGGVLRRVQHGQMMGSYLSFPLLCLQSYCAATWAARFDDNARFLVNGDDCVISASRAITERDYPYGYRLNVDKTIRAQSVVEVNSTAFLRSKGGWREVRNLRRGGATTNYQGMLHMAKAVMVSPGWTDAYQRCRIGRGWGFLPSQLGHMTYVSYKRERQMMTKRHFTSLPELEPGSIPSSLRRIPKEEATDLSREALREFMWNRGRWGLKRDVWNPSRGSIRRTFSYRSRPARSYLRFVTWKRELTSQGRGFELVPDSFETEEESLGLFKLDLWNSSCPLAE